MKAAEAVRRGALAVVWGLAAGSSWAQTAAQVGLPLPVEVLRAAVQAQPRVAAAEAALAAARARGEALQAGPYEWTARLALNRRDDRAADQRLSEQEIALETGLRLPGKAQTDGQLAALGVQEQVHALAQARREVLHELLAETYALLAAQREAAVQAELVAVSQRQLEVALRRERAGEAAKLETLAARADLARVQAAAEAAQAQAAERSAAWLRRYPGVLLPDAAAVPALEALVARMKPLESAAAQAAWVEQLMAQHPDLAAAGIRTALARTEARRAEQDRLADPTVGVRTARERGGQERVWGVYVSVPIGGAARQAAVAAALAQADRAEREQAQTRQRVQAEAWRMLGEALQGVRQAQRQQVAAQALVRSAQLQERAWTLGEGTLSDVLLAQRTAAEARLAAERAHVDAAAALARLEAHSPSVWADAGR